LEEAAQKWHTLDPTQRQEAPLLNQASCDLATKRTSCACLALLVVSLAPLLASCGGGSAEGAGAAAPQASLAERAALVEKWRARELVAVPMKPVNVLGGLATGEIESLVDLKPECKGTNANGDLCNFKIDLGKDSDGDPADVVCSVTTDLPAYGVVLKNFLEKSGLDETPIIETKAVGEGLAVSFVANASREVDTKTSYGTAKMAALLAHGYFTLCLDDSAGLRATFARVTGHLFETLKFKDNPKGAAVFAYGYTERAGDRTAGFRFGAVVKRTDPEPGWVESNSHFFLETDGKSWQVKDAIQLVERDPKGTIEKLVELVWLDGKGPFTLSAKPSEDKKFRLKLEAGNQTNGLESTPKAPLNTELWAAPELLKVASGSSPSYRYAFLDVIDSDPAFHYITLTRTAPGVLLEDQEAAGGKKPAPTQAGASKDELQIDARGLVKKEVATQTTAELVHTWGDLPALLGGKGGKGKSGH
jgi:hypothetical protein